jgi:RNA polymerase sigma-70 factor (ECF subfamily)
LDEATPDQSPSPDEAMVRNEEYRRTFEAMKELPEIDRTVLLLRAEEDLSYQDIAAATGLSAVAAKVKVFRARAKLTALLKPKIGERI